jgi:hypothetical protein
MAKQTIKITYANTRRTGRGGRGGKGTRKG